MVVACETGLYTETRYELKSWGEYRSNTRGKGKIINGGIKLTSYQNAHSTS